MTTKTKPSKLFYMQFYYTSHKEQKREYDKNYREINKGKIARKDSERKLLHKDFIRIIHSKYELLLKETVLKRYGNGKCQCAKCGCTDINALSIDHINGGGTQHRKTVKRNFYKYLIDNNIPDGYQVLCMNCQAIKVIENNECHTSYDNHTLLNTPKAIKDREYSITHKLQIRQRQLIIKTQVLTHYGNGKLNCVKCGFSDIRALCLDHINGGGSKQRSNSFRGGYYKYYLLKTQIYPNGYQTLCMNCNYSKRITNNECLRDWSENGCN